MLDRSLYAHRKIWECPSKYSIESYFADSIFLQYIFLWPNEIFALRTFQRKYIAEFFEWECFLPSRPIYHSRFAHRVDEEISCYALDCSAASVFWPATLPLSWHGWCRNLQNPIVLPRNEITSPVDDNNVLVDSCNISQPIDEVTHISLKFAV